MGVVGVRDRKVAIVPGRVIDELKQEERWVPMREIMQRPGVTMAVEGPWLDDWCASRHCHTLRPVSSAVASSYSLSSLTHHHTQHLSHLRSAVPPEVAAQYNTSPHYSGPHPPLEPEPPTSIREGSSGEMNA